MRPTLRTDRLTLRSLHADDEADLVALNGDHEVMAYIGPTLGAAEVATKLPAWVAGHGDFGLWTGHADDRFVGVWFLSSDTDEPRAGEIGWRLARSAWGNGYAVEGAEALVQHGFDTLGLDRIWAETMAVNVRSRRVMERLGMVHVRTEVRGWDDPIPGWEQGEVVYELVVGGT